MGLAARCQVLHRGPVRAVCAPPTRLPPCPRDIDAIWDTALKKNPNLHNGRLLVCAGLEKRGTEQVVLCNVVEYRTYLAHRTTGTGDLRPVAVSGIVESDGHYLFGKRHNNVTQYPGAWELVPSGGVSATYESGKEIDLESQLRRELDEEAEIPWGGVVACETLGLVLDEVEETLDVAFHLRLADEVAQQPMAGNEEYSAFRWVAKRQMNGFLAAQSELVPVSRVLWELRSRPE